MFDLSKPLLAQPELLLVLSDPELIRVVCSVAAFLGGMAVSLAAPALIVRCGRRVLFHKRSDAARRWGWAD